MRINFGWPEGPRTWEPVSCKSFAEANSMLAGRAAQLDARAGGYYKHDFELVDDTGEVLYSGRYDLYPLGRESDEGTFSPDLRKHVTDYVEFVGGLREDWQLPSHITPEYYTRTYRAPEKRAEAEEFLAALPE